MSELQFWICVGVAILAAAVGFWAGFKCGSPPEIYHDDD